MEKDLSGILNNFQRAWFELTGGRFAALEDGEELVLSVMKRKMPVDVRRALEEGTTLESFQVRGGTWWVTQPSFSLPKRFQIVAWAVKGEVGTQQALLQGWTDALAYAVHEQSVASRFTEVLAGAWDRLAFFYELAQIAGVVTDLAEMLQSIVDLLSHVVAVDEVFVAVHEEGVWQTFTTSKSALKHPELLGPLVDGSGRPMDLGELRSALVRAGSPLADYGDVLIAPLAVEGEPTGVIGFLDSRMSSFSANDVQLLASVAERVCALIEAVRARAVREDQQKLERELEIAANIQVSLLPKQLPRIPHVDLGVHLQPARHVGGDIYDVAESMDGDPLVMLADVAGKGSPAAILTAVVHATFRGQAPFYTHPSDLMVHMGRLLFEDLDKADTFVTAIIVRLLQDPLAVEYASAGHVDAILWRHGKAQIEFLPATGIPLGIEIDNIYQLRRIRLNPGDLLLVYSDGVTESEDPDGKVLGLQGLSDIIYATNPASVDDQIETLQAGLEIHRNGLPPRDDVALLLVRAQQEEDSQRKIVPFVLPTEFSAVRQVVDLVRNLGTIVQIEVSDQRRQILEDFALAVSEIVANQITHAFRGRRGRIQGRIEIESERLIADLFDHGEPYSTPGEHFTNVDGEKLPEEGYGLMLAGGLLDACEYRRLEGVRNHWRLVKNLTGVANHEN